ncbi:unnamed protein product [Trichobilharzia regenti]|nr:unnamed protein product [Trichobilharzia regenti]
MNYQSSSSSRDSAQLTITAVKFWRLVRALSDFIEQEGEGQLPVRGSLPDMISDSHRYLKLLSIYRERSEWAVERLASRLTQVRSYQNFFPHYIYIYSYDCHNKCPPSTRFREGSERGYFIHLSREHCLNYR